MTERKIIVGVALGLICAGSVLASPLLYKPDLWNVTDASWVVSAISLNDSTPGLNPSNNATGVNAARITFTGGGETPAARLSATSGNFVGNLQNDALSVSFILNSVDRAPAQQPGSLALYFLATDGGNTNRWFYDQLNLPAGTGLTGYSVAMGTQGLWTQVAGPGGANYSNDLASVIEFGFEIRGWNEYVTQNYEIQDVQFTVPEPETVWMILMVLTSLGITFRSRLMELAGQVKARIRA